MFKKIVKRDGRIVDFDSSKITNAIFKAGQATGEFGMDVAKKLTIKVLDLATELIKDKIPTVEEIQDIVEEVLLHSPYKKTAKAYIIYREQHAKIREITTKANLDLINQYLNQIDWRVKENSNMSFSLQGLNNYVSSEIVKTYWLNSIYPPEVRRAYIEGDFHIHDLGSLSVYCVGWDLYDLLLTGFRGAPGKVESSPAKHFRTALGQIVNFFYSLQGEAAGAQAFSNFDTLLAPFIRYDGLSYKDVKQCIQEFLFNLNVPTRVGFQSLDWDELVVIKHKGKIKFVEIGKLVDEKFEKNSHRIIEQHPSSFAVQNYDDYYALSFDSHGKAVWARIKAFIRHKVPKDSKFIKIRTNRGEVKVSPAHSLFAFEKFDSNFNPKPVKPYEVEIAKDYRHLNEKNHFLALSKLENNSNKEELDLVELIDEFPQIHKNVFVKINPTRTLSQIKHKIIQEYQAIYPFYVDFGIRDRKVWKEWLKRKSIRYDIWRKFGEQKRETLFKLKNSKIWYPRILKGEILENFVKLSAWYVGEGHKGISVPLFVSQADPENVKEILKILKKLKSLGEIQKNQGYYPKGNKTKIVRKIAGKGLLSEIISLSCGIMAFNKVVPWYIFELSTKYQKIFIQELLKGEAKEYKNHWDLSTTSRKLASSLSLLLAQNNIRFSVYTEKPREKNKNWRNQWIIRVFKENFPARKEYKVEDFEARVCLGKEEYEYKNEFEYDISVDLPQENFVGGVGLLVFHNTPFTNLTFDLVVSPVYKDQPVVIGGKLQNKTYGEFQEEMNMINKAFFEVMQEGDAKGRVFTFPIPTYNITKDFDWNNEILDGLWEMTGKYGIPYFANFINSDMKPEDVRSMCCRLRLNLRHLQKKGGGLFGANPLTGSIGVVTIDLPRIGYLSKSKEEFKSRLNDLLYIARESLEIKRKVIERLTDENLYPYSKFYLRNIKERFGKYWVNHFSTIGIIGMNEACLNLFGKDIGTEEGIEFAKEIMLFMREKLEKFQEETGNIYNLEATPAEGTSYRLAKIDKNKFPDIIVANEEEYRKGAEPFYTNSTHLPVNYTDDIFEVLEKQDQLQTLYTGGTVIHIFVGEKIDSKEGIKKLVSTICKNFRLPYFTISPTFSVCPDDGYIKGEHFTCPKCGSITEVYSRIVGYLRPVSQWNKGKYEEFKLRRTFVLK